MPKPSQKPGMLAWQIAFVFILVAMAMPLVGSKFVLQQISKEQQSVMLWYGESGGSVIVNNADRWFRFCANDSDLMNRTIYAFSNQDSDSKSASPTKMPTTDGYDPDGKQIHVTDSYGRFKDTDWRRQPSTISDPAANYHNHLGLWWITAVFAIWYFAFLRLAELLAWIPMLIPLCVSIVVTGYARQKLKWNGFGGISPRFYRAGGRLSTWFLGIGAGLIVAPGALPPITVPASIVLVFIGVAMVVSNLQKPA